MKDIIAALLKLTHQIAPFQGRYDEVCRSLEHIRCVFQRLYRRIIHAVKSNQLFAVIERNHHKGMNLLPFQILILKGLALADLFQVFNDNMFPDAEIPVPTGAHLRRDILKILLFRLHPVGRPLISIVIAAGLVPLEYVGSLPVQCLSQMLQQHLQRLIRSLLLQGNAKALIDDGFQILDALYFAVLPAVPVNPNVSSVPLQNLF